VLELKDWFLWFRDKWCFSAEPLASSHSGCGTRT